MIRSPAMRKVLRSGLLGLAGAFVGCVLGEPLFWIGSADADGAPSLVTRPEPPPPSPEFKSRLDKAGARTGEIQVSLLWGNINDLDLHCIEPDGQEISYRQRFSRSGGNLDVDQNRGCDGVVTNPVENIYWPKGSAAVGDYRVFVNFYARCGSEAFPTDFKVNALVGTERKEFTGTLRAVQNSQLVHTFHVARQVKLYPALQRVSVRPDAPTRLTVEVERQFFRGPVTVRADNLPAGIAVDPVTLSADEDRCDLVFRNTGGASGTSPIQLVGSSNAADVTPGTTELLLAPPAWWSWWTILQTALWTALVAAGLATALILGQNRYLGRPWLAEFSQLLVPLGTAVGGFASGAIGQAFQFLFAVVGLPGTLGYLIGWALLGGLVGSLCGRFIPNLSQRKAAVAGLAGGVLGVVGFLILAMIAVELGRFFGAAVLGFCIGAMVAWVESAFRRAWLEVRFGERETITVNLGPEPVKVGGDSRACAVWVRGAAPVALRYFLRDGKVICHDVGSNDEKVVGEGQSRTLGNVCLTVHTASGEAPNNPPAPARIVTGIDPSPHRPEPPPVRPPIVTPPVRPVAPPPPIPAAAGIPKPAFPDFKSAPPKPPAPAISKPPLPDFKTAPPKPPTPPASGARCPECGAFIDGKPGLRICKACGSMS